MSDLRSIPDRSASTWAAVRLLAAAQVGEVVTYEALTKVIGRDAQHAGAHHVRSARFVVKREHAMVFACVVNVGVKRLPDDEKIAEARGRLRRSASQAREGLRSLACVDDFSALTPEMKIQHNTTAAQLGAIRAMATSKTAKRLEAKIGDQLQRLSPGETLKLMDGI